MVAGCPVADPRPPIIMGPAGSTTRFDVMRDGWSCLKPALQTAARAAYEKSRMDPQLIVMLLPVC